MIVIEITCFVNIFKIYIHVNYTLFQMETRQGSSVEHNANVKRFDEKEDSVRHIKSKTRNLAMKGNTDTFIFRLKDIVF